MTDHPTDHNHLEGLPSVATTVEVVGGPADGATVAVVDTRDCLLSLLVTPAGELHVRTQLGPVEQANVLRQIAKAASLRAQEWLAEQS